MRNEERGIVWRCFSQQRLRGGYHVIFHHAPAEELERKRFGGRTGLRFDASCLKGGSNSASYL